MSTTRYCVRHFADHAMASEVCPPRFTSDWGTAWNEMHRHKMDRPAGLRLSVIERITGSRIATEGLRRLVSIVERFEWKA